MIRFRPLCLIASTMCITVGSITHTWQASVAGTVGSVMVAWVTYQSIRARRTAAASANLGVKSPKNVKSAKRGA